MCLPVVTCQYVPLVDYPSHLARVYIEAHYDEVPAYQQNFVRTNELLPNLAVDLIGRFLLHFMGIITFSRVFLGLTVLLFALGCHMLSSAIRGRRTMVAILCAYLVYNSMLLYGFVNYVFGLGMFCVTLACFLRYRQEWTPWRLLLVGALVFLSYFAHETAYAYIGASFFIVGTLEYRATRRWNRLLPGLCLLVPEALYYFAHRHHNLAAGIAWGSLRQKAIGMIVFATTYSARFDVVFLFLLLVILALAFRLSKKRYALDPVLAAGVFFLACFVLAPYQWMGGSPVDSRFVVPGLLLVILSVDWSIPRPYAGALFTACLLLFSCRVGAIWRIWHASDDEIRRQVEMLDRLPEGAAVYTAFLTADSGAPLSKIDRALQHVSEYATITRHAFIPTQLAKVGQETLLFRNQPRYKAPMLKSSDWITSMHEYEFVWSYAFPDSFEQILAANCSLVATAGKGKLWRVLAPHVLHETQATAPQS